MADEPIPRARGDLDTQRARLRFASSGDQEHAERVERTVESLLRRHGFTDEVDELELRRSLRRPLPELPPIDRIVSEGRARRRRRADELVPVLFLVALVVVVLWTAFIAVGLFLFLLIRALVG